MDPTDFRLLALCFAILLVYFLMLRIGATCGKTEHGKKPWWRQHPETTPKNLYDLAYEKTQKEKRKFDRSVRKKSREEEKKRADLRRINKDLPSDLSHFYNT